MTNKIFEEIRKTQTPLKYAPIVKAKKKLHKGYLFGHISNGNGIIKLDDGYALKIIALDKDYVVIHLLDYGKELQVETQTWQKTKDVEKETEPSLDIKEEVKKVDLF